MTFFLRWNEVGVGWVGCFNIGIYCSYYVNLYCILLIIIFLLLTIYQFLIIWIVFGSSFQVILGDFFSFFKIGLILIEFALILVFNFVFLAFFWGCLIVNFNCNYLTCQFLYMHFLTMELGQPHPLELPILHNQFHSSDQCRTWSP